MTSTAKKSAALRRELFPAGIPETDLFLVNEHRHVQKDGNVLFVACGRRSEKQFKQLAQHGYMHSIGWVDFKCGECVGFCPSFGTGDGYVAARTWLAMLAPRNLIKNRESYPDMASWAALKPRERNAKIDEANDRIVLESIATGNGHGLKKREICQRTHISCHPYVYEPTFNRLLRHGRIKRDGLLYKLAAPPGLHVLNEGRS